jgi:hypothetical protein
VVSVKLAALTREPTMVAYPNSIGAIDGPTKCKP